jgi:hypothetical protein
VTSTLGDLVRDRWSALLADGFNITDEDNHRVAMASSTVQIVAIHDPRGEVDVSVEPLGQSWPKTWTYCGMVGRAPVGRLLELALSEMQAEPAILSGDLAFYKRLGIDNQDLSEAWTDYCGRRGPRPGERQLP